ncbi:SAVED domain-containing protein [Methylomusa anaerophila]|nr:SAVED domain-containing protein [Methylomusa anaerophila]
MEKTAESLARKFSALNNTDNLLRIYANCCLSGGFLLGRNFSYTRFHGVQLEVSQYGKLWAFDKEIKELRSYPQDLPSNDRSSNDAIVMISVTHDISGPVERYLQANPHIRFRKRVNILPENGPGGDSIKFAAEAVSYANAVKDIADNLRYGDNIKNFHLFFDCPLSLAIFIGHRLTACNRIQTYEFLDAEHDKDLYGLSWGSIGKTDTQETVPSNAGITSVINEIVDLQQSGKDKVEIFISYSHVDDKFRQELVKHLKSRERKGLILCWYDRMIEAEWEPEIKRHLESSKIILLLVSVDFINSDYCWDVEMKRAMERHDNGEAIVIPVILRDCDWKDAPFAKLLAIPTDGKPINKWDDRDSAFLDVAMYIRRKIEKMVNPS